MDFCFQFFFVSKDGRIIQWKERVLIITLSTTAVDSAEKKHRRSWFIVRQHFYQKYDGMVYLSFTRCYANSSVGTVFKRKTQDFLSDPDSFTSKLKLQDKIMASSSQSFFTENQLKICNKLHRTPKWAQDPKRANTDKKLMTAKVQSYIVELGNHIMNQVDASQQSKAWEFVAERSASKLDSKHLSQLYLDIMQESTATVTEDT